jgi:hypothetical protein
MSATEVLLLEGQNTRRKDFDRTLGAERIGARRLEQLRGFDAGIHCVETTPLRRIREVRSDIDCASIGG